MSGIFFHSSFEKQKQINIRKEISLWHYQTLFFLVGLLLFVLLAGIGLHYDNHFITFAGATICALCIAFGIGMYFKGMNNNCLEVLEEASEKRNELEIQAIALYENGDYTAYLDGNLVKMENIDLSHYFITIDHEEKKIILTTIPSTTHTKSTAVLPMPIFFH